MVEDAELHFGSGSHCYVEDGTILREPRVRPSAVIANSCRRDAVNTSNRFSRISHVARSSFERLFNSGTCQFRSHRLSAHSLDESYTGCSSIAIQMQSVSA